jgi:hypothetical protein
VNGRSGLRAFNVSLRGRHSWRDESHKRHEGKEARNEYYEGLGEAASTQFEVVPEPEEKPGVEALKLL